MPRPFKRLVKSDDKKEEKRDVGHAAHDCDIGFAEPADRAICARAAMAPPKPKARAAGAVIASSNSTVPTA